MDQNRVLLFLLVIDAFKFYSQLVEGHAIMTKFLVDTISDALANWS